MVPLMYTDLPEFMHPAAARSVLAATVYMVENGTLATEGDPDLESVYRLA